MRLGNLPAGLLIGVEEPVLELPRYWSYGRYEQGVSAGRGAPPDGQPPYPHVNPLSTKVLSEQRVMIDT
ncbi:hypothetical protein FRC02_002761 [Tulasnella sp. 418]|nr:hypothetical protein FRC02_002761 [Tulasnella sp. 418]